MVARSNTSNHVWRVRRSNFVTPIDVTPQTTHAARDTVSNTNITPTKHTPTWPELAAQGSKGMPTQQYLPDATWTWTL